MSIDLKNVWEYEFQKCKRSMRRRVSKIVQDQTVFRELNNYDQQSLIKFLLDRMVVEMSTESTKIGQYLEELRSEQ